MRSREDKPLSSVLNEMISEYKLAPKLEEARVREVWEQRMGKMISKYTDYLYFNNGKIIVGISSAPLKQELNMSTERILQIMRESLNTDAIKEISIR